MMEVTDLTETTLVRCDKDRAKPEESQSIEEALRQTLGMSPFKKLIPYMENRT